MISKPQNEKIISKKNFFKQKTKKIMKQQTTKMMPWKSG